MPDLVIKDGEAKPVDGGGVKPAPVPLAVSKPRVCDCKRPLRRFVEVDTKTGLITTKAYRCARCACWYQQFTTFGKTTLQLTTDPRPLKAAPVIGEVEVKP